MTAINDFYSQLKFKIWNKLYFLTMMLILHIILH
jgi:hypothetical protein